MFEPPKGKWEVVPFARSSATDAYIEELDRTTVEWFLRQFKSNYGIMSHLRDVLAPTDPVSRLTDDQVIKTVAWRLATRDLMFRRWAWRLREVAPSSGEGSADNDAPDYAGAAVPAAAPRPSQQAEEPDPNTFGDGHDAQAQAAGLQAAAAAGVPFCEECQKRGKAA